MGFNPLAWLRGLVGDGKVLKRSGNTFVGVDPGELSPAGDFEPATTDAYDLGETSTPKRWRWANLSRGIAITHAVIAGSIRTAFTFTGAADTACTASTEQPDFYINGARTVQWATGALTTQRMIRVRAPTYAFVGASTITDAVTLDIDAAPTAGANATITNSYALRVVAGAVLFGGSFAVTGAASFNGNVTLGDAATDNITLTGAIVGDVALRKEANHVIAVEASTTTDTAGANLSIAAGDGAATNGNGGNAALDAGAKAGSGTSGTLSLGATNAEAVAIGRTGKTTTVAGPLSASEGANVTGDLTATGGFRSFLPFGVANVAAGDNATPASSTPVQVGWGANGAVLAGFTAVRAGSLMGLSAALSEVAAGSDIIVGIYKNGTIFNAATIITIAAAAQTGRTTFAKDTYTFVPGDVIDVRIRTGSGWSASTADLAVAVEIEQ